MQTNLVSDQNQHEKPGSWGQNKVVEGSEDWGWEGRKIGGGRVGRLGVGSLGKAAVSNGYDTSWAAKNSQGCREFSFTHSMYFWVLFLFLSIMPSGAEIYYIKTLIKMHKTIATENNIP